jgi:hypothetical protein
VLICVLSYDEGEEGQGLLHGLLIRQPSVGLRYPDRARAGSLETKPLGGQRQEDRDGAIVSGRKSNCAKKVRTACNSLFGYGAWLGGTVPVFVRVLVYRSESGARPPSSKYVEIGEVDPIPFEDVGTGT